METKNLNLTPEGDGANKEKGAKSGSKFEKVAKAATVVVSRAWSIALGRW